MKLQRKHALSCVKYIVDYLEAGYYPLEEITNERAMMGKIFGVGLYQELVTMEVVDKWIKKMEVSKPKKSARLDLTESEMRAILDMFGETMLWNDEFEHTNEYEQLRKYLENNLDSE